MKVINLYLIACGLICSSGGIQGAAPEQAASQYNDHMFKEYDEKFALHFLSFYIARALFEGKTDDQIEQEMLSQANKIIAIRMYAMARNGAYKFYHNIHLKPLEDLLGMQSDQIRGIVDNPDTKEEILFLCNKTVGNKSTKEIESQVKNYSHVNENFGFAVYDFACGCGKRLRPYNQIVPGTSFPSTGTLFKTILKSLHHA